MKRLFLILGLLFPSIAYAQGALYSNVALSAAGRPLGGANVSVCGYPATAGTAGNTCTTLITIYSDKALSVPISQTDPAHPFVTDGFGNYSFWVNPTTCSPSNACTIQVSGPGVTTTLLPFTVGGGGGGGIPAWYLNNTLVGIEPNYDVIPGANTTITATNDSGASRVHYTLNATPSVTVQHNGTFVGTEPIVNLIDGANVTLTLTNNVGATRVDATVAASSGSGCSVGTLLDQWVVSIHPNHACYGSIDFTFDDSSLKKNLLVGDGSNAAPSASFAFLSGSGNSSTGTGLCCGDFYFMRGNGNTSTLGGFLFMDGVSNTLTDSSDAYVYGEDNALDHAGNDVVLGFDNNITPATPNTQQNVTDSFIVGQDNLLHSISGSNGIKDAVVLGFSNQLINTNTTGGSSREMQGILVGGENNTLLQNTNNLLQDVHIVGTNNTVGNTLNDTLEVEVVGESNQVDGSLSTLQVLGFSNIVHNASPQRTSTVNTTVVGSANTVTNTGSSGSPAYQGVFGGSSTLQNCNNCWIVGDAVSNSTSSTLAIGMSATPEIVVTPGNVTLAKKTFASLPACAAGTEGSLMPVTDSSTITWGATITGGSTNHVLAYCDGTNWTVMAK